MPNKNIDASEEEIKRYKDVAREIVNDMIDETRQFSIKVAEADPIKGGFNKHFSSVVKETVARLQKKHDNYFISAVLLNGATRICSSMLAGFLAPHKANKEEIIDEMLSSIREQLIDFIKDKE